MKYLSNDRPDFPSPAKPPIERASDLNLLIIGVVIGAALLAYQVLVLISIY
ncbi:hypothetical protein IB237_14815 [Agrobacterium sp. AGB01]|uniref:hypothetical protein n=1 Tax=Agrobacterium sp. AGB01 TaxID=2769302 RepID=UPI0017863E2E|nr:hypothetical protein [Agrobacterium sp. AGB01]MBD9388454.1 hypothetical protein [Agrobacterium sp. AGB01]